MEKDKKQHKSKEVTAVKQQNDNKNNQTKRLYRSKKNQMIAGVCAGLGEYFTIDPTVVRLIFVIATIFGGYGVIVYIILWIILPEESDKQIGAEDTVKENVAAMRSKAEKFASGLRSGSNEGRTRVIFGAILVGLGIIFFLDNFGIFRADIFWPLVLIAIGVLILRR